MKVLAINCGFSTLKFQLFEFEDASNPLRQLSRGALTESRTVRPSRSPARAC
jgi:acetate kinase